MQKVKSLWQGGQKNSVFFNQDINLLIDEKGPRPTDLLLAGLIGCSQGVFLEITEKMRIKVNSISMEAEAERESEPPKLFSKIALSYHIEVDEGLESKVVRAIKLVEQYCTVFNIMKLSADIEVLCYINGVKQLIA
ncbi:OsmC family protein [Desulfosporosinus sp. FKB]|uniref:OsmC family protein n=1 Tax=Desulfosporosinus sp. FKB TaxID=1969835 RepID=UPI000B4A07F5|nr:OsmC family protein [Desulfosporosinus sp. FKB]